MLKLTNLSKATLLAAFFLLLTGCNNKTKTDMEANLTTSVQSSQGTLDQDTVMQQEDSNGSKSSTPAIGKTTLNKAENTTGTAKLEIPLIINGYTLPPEPEQYVNDSTLLGVDVNDNGVRDDVERYIYEKFPKEVRRQTLMQEARAHQSMLADPDAIDNAGKWQKIIANKPIACESYLFRRFDIEFDIEATEYMEDKLYNNKDRLRKYMEYNHALGGGVYGVEENERVESACEFNVTQALKDDL